MRKMLLMEAVLDETRLAIIEDGALCELTIDRPGSRDLAGSIYLGRVENTLPGMNAAFVDIGIGRNGFLSGGDVRPGAVGDDALAEAMKAARRDHLPRLGQMVLVQVEKAQTGQKGARLTCDIALPGRNMALMPGVRYVGVSRKITDSAERNRLRAIGEALMDAGGMGLILRTASENADEEALRGEYAQLQSLWRDVEMRAKYAASPVCLYSDASLEVRVVRDMLREDVDALWVDDERLYQALVRRAEALAPQWRDRIRLHDGSTPLFDLYRVDEQAFKAMQKYVWLKSGGSLVVEQTEALTVVDVNTGKYTGHRHLAETVFRNNCEAAREIMRQLRLRDIGGIIVIDFIDMDDPEQRTSLLALLREEAKRDRNRVNVVGMTALGLVEMTRKKVRQSLARQLMHTCEACDGNGTVPSHETTARRIEREIWRRRRAGETNPILVEARAPVCARLMDLGAPSGGAVYICACDAIEAGQFRLSPADPANLPHGAKCLK